MRTHTLPADATSAPFRLLTAGRFMRGDREVEITVSDLERAVENFAEDQAAGREVPLDYDHAFMRGGSSRASGWIRSLVQRGGELLAQVAWTPPAREAIERGEFRYVSAEFERDHVTEDGRHRGFAILAAGITNRPFLRDLGEVALSSEATPVEAAPPEPLTTDGAIEERPPPADAEAKLAEVEALISGGALNVEACQHQLRAAELMTQRDLTFEDAAAAAWREIR